MEILREMYIGQESGRKNACQRGVKMVEPKISVIMCVYNREDFLRKSLDSVCNQTLQDIEIILINDGSTDGSYKIMQEYARKDSRIKLVDQENMGLGLSRNVGLKMASGQYVTFVDSDDWIALNTLEKAYSCTDQGKYDEVVFNFVKVFPDGKSCIMRKIIPGEIDISKMGLDHYILKYFISYTHEYGSTNKIFRRSIIEEHNIVFPDNRKVMHEDILFNLKFICFARKIYAIPDGLYYYYIHEGTLSDMNKSYQRLVDGYSNIVELYREHLEKNGLYKQYGSVLPLLYYSMVYFGIIRAKHFGHIDISGCAEKMADFPHYKDYMKEIGQWSVRKRFLTETLPGIGTIKNWQLIGLLFLTSIQGKIVSAYALKDNFKKVEKWI